MSAARVLRNRHGELLEHVLTPGRPGARELVLVAHGVTSSCDRPYLVELCEALAAAGLASLRFSFAGNGRSEGRFEDCTISKEIEDLGSVLDACADRRVAYVGHSMGAAVGVSRAAIDERIQALVSLAGMVRVQRFVQRHFGALRVGEPMLGRERCPLSQALLDDARALDTVLPGSAKVRVPWFLVHGTADELVPLDDSLAAREATAGRAQLTTIEGADHRFTGHVADVIAAAVPFLAAWRDGELA